MEYFHPKICLSSYFQVMNLIGDVKGKVAVMLDDMIDTAGELNHIYVAILLMKLVGHLLLLLQGICYCHIICNKLKLLLDKANYTITTIHYAFICLAVNACLPWNMLGLRFHLMSPLKFSQAPS